MKNENEISTGLWTKTSAKGTTYYSGKLTIDGKEYWVNLFKNNNKTEEKHPDLNLLLNPVSEPSTDSVKLDDIPITDDDLPF